MKFLLLTIALAITATQAGKVRISKGNNAALGQFPYQALLQISNEKGKIFRCGGSIIHPNWILTAAHCTHGKVGASAIVGRVHTKEKNEGKEYKGDKIITHEKFNPKSLENDVALIHIPEDIEYNDNVDEIALPSKNENYVGNEYIVSGYGHMGKEKPLATTLQYTTLEVIADSKCEKLYNHEEFDGTKICALGKDGRSTCSGDSGGPLAAKDYIIGLVSFGKGSCDGHNPSGYTKVKSFVPWIKSKTGM